MADSGVSDDALLAGMAVGDERAAWPSSAATRGGYTAWPSAWWEIRCWPRTSPKRRSCGPGATPRFSIAGGRRSSTWMLTITRNLAVDALRLRRPVVTDPVDVMWANLVSRTRHRRNKPSQKMCGPGWQRRWPPSRPSKAGPSSLAAVYGYTAAEVGEVERSPLARPRPVSAAG